MDPLPGDALSERMSLGADSLEARTAESEEGSHGGTALHCRRLWAHVV